MLFFIPSSIDNKIYEIRQQTSLDGSDNMHRDIVHGTYAATLFR